MTSPPVALVPFRHPLRWTRALAILAIVVPPCAVAIGIGVGNGHLVPGIALLGAVVLAGALAVVVVERSRILLEPGAVRRLRPGSRPILLESVAKAVLRRVHNRDEVTSQRQLFLLDAEGRAVLRMSDRWWTDRQIRRVVDHVGAPLEVTEEVVYPAELRRAVPGQLRWSERHPWSWLLIRGTAVAAAALLLAALATGTL